MWSLRIPDCEANARPHVDAVGALRGILPDKAIRDPHLQVDRAEVVANQATGRRGLIPAADVVSCNHSGRRCGIKGTGTGVGGGLNFGVPDRADRPLTELKEPHQIGVERVAAGDRASVADLLAADALRPRVDVIEEVRARDRVSAEVGEGYPRLKGPVVRVRRASLTGARRGGEVEECR